jgi:hypothetical protein
VGLEAKKEMKSWWQVPGDRGLRVQAEGQVGASSSTEWGNMARVHLYAGPISSGAQDKEPCVLHD